MLSETDAEIQFPATCARCGARVAERVSFCPNCGTHARLAFATGARKPQSSQAAAKENPSGRPTGVPPWTARPQPLFAAAADADPFAGIAAPIRDDGPDSGRQWGVKAGTALTLAAFVALFGAIVLLHRHDDASSKEQQATLRTVEGSVQAGARAHNAQPGDSNNGNNGRAARANAPAVAAAQAPATVAPAAPVTPPAPAPNSQQSLAVQNIRPDHAYSGEPSPPSADSARATNRAELPKQAAPENPPPAAIAQTPAEPPRSATATAPNPPARADAARERRQSRQAPAVTRAPENSAYASVAPKRATRHGPGAYTPPGAVPAQPAMGQPDIGSPSYAANDTQAMQGANALRERRQASTERSIALAQASLAKSNLAAARRALDAAQASQPGNSEAFMLQQDLISREKTRDSALNSARVCAVQQEWNCTWHQAGRALSIDAGSVEAKALVQRAMVESGAAFRPAGPGPDGPDVPLLAQ